MAADRNQTPATPASGEQSERQVRIFVSSPSDARFERIRVERVVERLNGEFAGVAVLHAVRWEREFYKAHATFQAQIPEAADCDIVVAILKHRIGTELPADFRHMPDGQPYPSGTAYEILTAMEAGGRRGLPDLYVFRYPEPPTVKLDDAETNAAITEQWNRLKVFFATWFHTPGGQFKASYHEFRSTDDFEAQVESLLRKWLEEKVLKGRAVAWPIETKGSPFRGLGSFGPKHAPVFFGRTRDIARAIDALKDAAERQAAFLLIVGASGVGKSSLAKAGLAPRLTTPGVVAGVDVWRVAELRASDVAGDATAALAARLFEGPEQLSAEERGRYFALPELRAGDYRTPESLAALLAHADDSAAKPILAALDKVGQAERDTAGHDRPVRADLLIVIDQMDDLFAGAADNKRLAAFARLLSVLAATGRVWIIATLRADLYERFLKEPLLLQLKARGAAYDLAPPGAAELAEIVRGPAAAADLAFEEDPGRGMSLDETLLADADRPDMLPLLQFTLDQLFERRESRNGKPLLTFSAYQQLGGIAGAIDKQAERAIAKLGPEERERLPRLLRQLAEPDRDGEGMLAIRAVPLEEAGHDASARALVEALVDARILLSSTDDGQTVVRLAHQRVLESWSRAREIVATNAGFFRIRGNVEDQRRRWEESGRKADLLIPRGIPLAEAESIALNFGGEIAPPSKAFIATSGKRARRFQRLMAGAAAVFAVIAAIAGWQTIEATAQRRDAMRERDRAAENFNLAEARRIEAETERDRAEQNFDAAKIAINGLVFNVVQQLREMAGFRLTDLRTILEQAQRTIDQLGETAADDLVIATARAAMLTRFADVLQALGDTTAAIDAGRQAVAIARGIAERNPDDLDIRRNLAVALSSYGGVLITAGAIADAEGPVDEAIALIRGLAGTAIDPLELQLDLAAGLDRLGAIRLALGDYAGAVAAFEEGLSLSRGLVAAAPEEPSYRRVLSVALNKLGDLWRALGDVPHAIALYDEGLTNARELHDADPTNTVWLRDLSIALHNVGDARIDADDLAGAGAAYEEAIAIARTLISYDPLNTDFQRDLTIALNRMGNVRFTEGDFPGALALYEEALALSRQIAARDPSNNGWQRDLAVSLDRTAGGRSMVGDAAGALAAFEEGLAISRQLVAADPSNMLWQSDLIISIYKVGLSASGERRAAMIAEGVALVESLVAAGRLTADDRALWLDYFNGIVEPAAGAEPAPAPGP